MSELMLRRELLFASPVFLSIPAGKEELRRELRRRLLDEAAARPGIARSNIGGWHSELDLLERSDPCWRELGDMLLECSRAVLQDLASARGRTPPAGLNIGASAWGMVMRHGNYSTPHHHGDAHWAAVYYVDVGDQDASVAAPAGQLSFLDPRGPLKGGDPMKLSQTRQDIRPKDGLLVFFPGWLQHHVHPYRGTRPRVSISCNLVVS